MSNSEITVDLATKVLSTIDAGLVAGIGIPEPGKMCVEAAVCYAMGLPHSDRPTCVSDVVRSLKIKLNDSNWSSNEARTTGLRRLGVAQLGSAGVVADNEFATRVSILAIQKYVPIALRAAASRIPSHATALIEIAGLCSLNPSIENAKKAKAAAYAAAAYAAAADAADAAADAAYAAAYAAYAAAAAAAYAYAADAAYAAAHAADAAYAAGGRRDAVLAEFGEDVVQILIEMKSPGSEFLYLTEETK